MSHRDAGPFAAQRAQFALPEGVIYLDGNSLGPPLKTLAARMASVVSDDWGGELVRGWNTRGWMDLPRRAGDRIGALIGAPAGSVIAGDSTSMNLLKALSAATALRSGRRVILSDTGNFPTDLYVAQGVAETHGLALRTVAPEDVGAALDNDVAVLMLTEVDYRTGRLHNMATLTAQAHAAGALAVWDLSHSAGALPVNLAAAGADFAVGCGYKYLNGGPGAPGFLFVHPRWHAVMPAQRGWMGHVAPFAFSPDYAPADGVARFAVGTPPILGLTALDAALDIWDGVDLADVRRASQALSQSFIDGVQRFGGRFGLACASPPDPDERGSQVSFRFPHGYALMQALIAHGVIGDFREPDLVRFGFAPLYVSMQDVDRAVAIIERILVEGVWRAPQYGVRAAVT